MLLSTWKRVVEESWYFPVLLGGAAAVGEPLDFLLYIIPYMAVVYAFTTFGIALVLNAIRGRIQGEK
jgi:hypothetical protein